jgi:hypothetical protein
MGRGKDPDVWGPIVWRWLHAIAREWDQSHSHHSARVVERVFTTLGSVLPCHECRIGYKKILARRRSSLRLAADEKTMQTWVYNLHDTVNAKLDKTSPPKSDVVNGGGGQRRRRGTGAGRRPKSQAKAHRAVGPALRQISGNYTNCGEKNKCLKYRAFLSAVTKLHSAIGDSDTSRRLTPATKFSGQRRLTATMREL